MKHVAACLLSIVPIVALAEAPTVEHAAARQVGGKWRFDVTVAHPDTGWEHFSDAWRVIDGAGNELALRVLHHPHEDEQPFTRSLSGVTIPDGITEVFVEARCSVDGWSGRLYRLKLR